MLEHFETEDKYVATGHVRIERDGVVVTADRAILFNKTGESELDGNVVYEDDSAIINTEKALLNLDKNTGSLENALIFLKERRYSPSQATGTLPAALKGQRNTIHYWIYGEKIAKLAEDRYYARSARISSCDSEPCLTPDNLKKNKYLGNPKQVASATTPPWAFHGSNVDIAVGDSITSGSTTLQAKGVPVFYTPHFQASLRGRETGFLTPLVGSSSLKGFIFKPSFFWAIDDNKDLTASVDYFSKIGVGKKLEYRYLDFDGKGAWSAYHIYDTDVRRNYWEIKGASDIRLSPDSKAYADINYVNHSDFYRRYAGAASNRFLQSSAEYSSYAGSNRRAYLLGQYLIDLNRDASVHELQRLPEAGYSMHPAKAGPFVFHLSSSITNFVRSEAVSGQRLDIMPTLAHTFGDSVRFQQSLSLRETAYLFKNDAANRSSGHRETFGYRASATMRFLKTYGSFTHVAEPSLEYNFVPQTTALPLLDSAELYDRIAEFRFSLMNYFRFRDSIFALRLSQPYEANPFAGRSYLKPMRLETRYNAKGYVVAVDVEHSFTEGETRAVNSQLIVEVLDRTSLSVGERYSKADNLMYYTFGVSTQYFKHWMFNAIASYDIKAKPKLRDVSLTASHIQQCWAVSSQITKRPAAAGVPSDFSFTLLFELKGIGVLKFL
ncbi:MAG: LPS-assembly protein [Nitrospirae bacterium]|nr:MAG: LPS-assembly protein [Nitrospirota bacterium]